MPRTPPPARLYKYQPFNPHTLANLKSAQIWFNAPARFNDPFDCALPIFNPSRLTDADYLKAFDHYQHKLGSTPEILEGMCPNGVPSQAFRDLIVRSIQDGFANRREI
jgi:hypothetical protein